MTHEFKAQAQNLFRNLGYRVGNTEYRLPYVNGKKSASVTKDLWGFSDFVAIRANVPGTTYVQATSNGAHRAHIRKVTEEIVVRENLETTLMAGNRFMIVSYGQRRRITAFYKEIGASMHCYELDLPDDDLVPSFLSRTDCVLI